MNNRETIEQVERGYRMAKPAHILYPESETHPDKVAQAQSNVYKVRIRGCMTKSCVPNFFLFQIMLVCWEADPFNRPTFEILKDMF